MDADETKQPFHVALAAIRAERGLTLRALAAATRVADAEHDRGYSFQHLRRLELGTEPPTPHAMTLVAQALEIEPRFFAEYRLARIRAAFDERAVGLEVALERASRLPDNEQDPIDGPASDWRPRKVAA